MRGTMATPMPICTKRLMLSIVGIPKLRESVVRYFTKNWVTHENGHSRLARNDCFVSPIEAPESGNKIKVLVPAYKREGMLAAERGDPKIVGGNGLAFPFQFEADG